MSDPITTRKISSGISWRRWWFGIRISRLWPLKALPAFGFKQDTLHVPLSLDLYSCDPFCSSIYFDYHTIPYSCVKTAERLKFEELPARPHRPPPLLSEELWAQQHDSIPSVSPTLCLWIWVTARSYHIFWPDCLVFFQTCSPLPSSFKFCHYLCITPLYFASQRSILTQVRKTTIQLISIWREIIA